MNADNSCPAVLVVGFNRPDTTSRVLESLRAPKPTRVFFAVDGPRPDKVNESERVSQVQGLVSMIDWDCDVKTLFRNQNLGCKLGVSEAINWFFQHVESGIILEDDCVAHASFFQYASELLEKYRDDERVFMISGDNFQSGRKRTDYSYYFSQYTHIWGWATWRRAWRLYDHKMSLWPELKAGEWLFDVLGDRLAAKYWENIFDETHGEKNTSWAYRWTYAAWVHGGHTILPNENLVSNIGFGEFATHTIRRSSPFAALPQVEMRFPLRHPPFLIRDTLSDGYTQRTMFKTAPLWRRSAKRLYKAFISTKTS